MCPDKQPSKSTSGSSDRLLFIYRLFYIYRLFTYRLLYIYRLFIYRLLYIYRLFIYRLLYIYRLFIYRLLYINRLFIYRLLYTAYRPGSTSPSSLFFHEFAVLLKQFALYNAQLVITGDLNLHLEDPSLPASSEFHTIIDQFGLTQHVAEPTHKAGGWLDVGLTRDDCIPTDVRVFPPTASDHGLVTATIPFLCDTPSYLIRQVRYWHNLDRAAFGSALLEIPAVADPSIMNDLPVADVFATYQSAMAEVFERLLPTRQARIRLCGLTPWFNAECRSLRREARRLERLYGRTRAPADRAAWVKYVRAMHRTYRDKEREHWEARIAAHSEQPKRLWATFNALLGRGRADRSSNPLHLSQRKTT